MAAGQVADGQDAVDEDDLCLTTNVHPRRTGLPLVVLSARDLQLFKAWIDLNREVIVGFWEGRFDDSGDLIGALRPLATSD